MKTLLKTALISAIAIVSVGFNARSTLALNLFSGIDDPSNWANPNGYDVNNLFVDDPFSGGQALSWLNLIDSPNDVDFGITLDPGKYTVSFDILAPDGSLPSDLLNTYFQNNFGDSADADYDLNSLATGAWETVSFDLSLSQERNASIKGYFSDLQYHPAFHIFKDNLNLLNLDPTYTGVADLLLGNFQLEAAATPEPSPSPDPVPVDLSEWTQEGVSTNGNWIVQNDGDSVLQTINSNPTFFVSPDEFFNTTVEGKFRVETNHDNDFMGFVFGYQSPISSNGDLTSDMEFFLFDWKQSYQSGAQPGFSLSKVNGDFSTTGNSINLNFWQHQNTPGFEVLATDYGIHKGWQDYVEYDFSLLYQSNRIKIDINDTTIFDISSQDVGEAFSPGRFGFYNLSQERVRYSGFTRQHTPVPEPGLVLGMLTALGVGMKAIEKRISR